MNHNVMNLSEDTNALEEWLDLMKLGVYKNTFQANGVNDLEAMSKINIK